MRKLLLRQSLLAGIAVFAVAIAAPITASAVPARAEEAQVRAQAQRDGATERVETAQSNSAERREAAQTRLDENKLKVCQKREKSVQTKMARIADRGTKQLGVFTKISDRTQAFYQTKGKTLSNYEALVKDVDDKKVAAEAALTQVRQTSVNFQCGSGDPKAAATAFKESLKSQQEALKAYKTAVKNLIVGVKSVQGTTSSGETQNRQEGSNETTN